MVFSKPFFKIAASKEICCETAQAVEQGTLNSFLFF